MKPILYKIKIIVLIILALLMMGGTKVNFKPFYITMETPIVPIVFVIVIIILNLTHNKDKNGEN